MTSYVSVDLRRLVESRANRVCEYGLIHDDDTYFGCQVEHIISLKHGGPTTPKNLAFACAICNRSKGTDLGTIVPNSAEFTRFFNPRIDRWQEHVVVDGLLIRPLSVIGEATVKILRFNDGGRLSEREALMRVG